MLAFVIGLAMAAGPGNDSARAQFSSCLKSAIEKGGREKIPPPGFVAYAKQNCAAQTSAFRASLIANDLKAGWTRKKAESDADSQVGDYFSDWADRYKDSLTPGK